MIITAVEERFSSKLVFNSNNFHIIFLNFYFRTGMLDSQRYPLYLIRYLSDIVIIVSLKRVKFEVFSIVSYAESRKSNYRKTEIKIISFQRKNNGYIILDQNKFLKGFVVKLKVTLITSTFPLKLRTGD